MLGELSNRKIVMDIRLPTSLKETIDYKRGDIESSKYISRIRERQSHEQIIGRRGVKFILSPNGGVLTIPDIQLQTAVSLFRLYIKSLIDRGACIAEESLIIDAILPEALDDIRRAQKSIESKLTKIFEVLQR